MSDDSFLREVEEELRSDKLKAFWRRYAVFIIGGAVLIVLAVAANEVYKWWRDSTAATASDQFYSASELAQSGDIAGAQAAFAELADGGPDGYAILAQFRNAALLEEEGDPEAAISAYDTLAAALDNRNLRQLALVLGGYVAVDHLDPSAVQARVGDMTGADNPFRNQAREALGLAYYKAGDFEAARTQFEEIAADANAAQDMQLRAFVYLEQLAAQGIVVDEELVEGETSTETAPEPEPVAE